MEKLSRNSKVVAITKLLLENPNKILGLNQFSDLLNAAKSTISEDLLVEAVRNVFDLRPAGIIEMLNLKRPIYRQTAAYGHFGRTDVDLPWEHTDRVEALKTYVSEHAE